MANARASALAARRTSGFGDSIRILAPASTGLSSLAKQTAANETDIMISKYNAGLIGNEEMKAFLQAQLNNQYVSASDKTQIQTKLLDFDVLIEKDRLESVFKQAPENSLAKMNAATALADFYTRRASSMTAGTPAHSQALENAGMWQANVKNIQDSVNKQTLSNYEDTMLMEINKLPTSSSDKASAMAEMYSKLQSLATQQGDIATANEYAARAAQQQTYAQQYAEAESQKSNKAIRADVINAVKLARNDYLTGQLSYEEYKNILIEANDYAVQNEDGTLLTSLTGYATEMEKQQAKGGPGGTNLGGSLFAKTKGTGGSGGGSAADQMSQDYSDDVRLFQEAYIKGVDASGQPYGEDRYKADMKEAVNDRIGSLETLYTSVMSMGDNEKVWWNGRYSKAGTVRDDIEKEWNKIQGMDQAIDAGTFMIMGTNPTEDIGKNTVKFEPIDTRFLNEQDQALLAVDDSGIGWTGKMNKVQIDDAEYETAKLTGSSEGYSRDPKTGLKYKETGLVWDVIDPVTGQIYKQQKDETGKLVSSAQVRKEATGLGYGEKDMVDFDPEFAKRVTEQQATMTAEQVAQHLEKKKKIDALQAQQLIDKQVKGLVTTAKPGLQSTAEKIVTPSATLKTTPAITSKEEFPLSGMNTKSPSPVTTKSYGTEAAYVQPKQNIQQSTQQSSQQSTQPPKTVVPTYVAPQYQQKTYQTYVPPVKTQSTAPVQQP